MRNKKKGMYFRFPDFMARCIEVEARRKHLSQVDYLCTCVALNGMNVKAGLTFKFEIVKPDTE